MAQEVLLPCAQKAGANDADSQRKRVSTTLGTRGYKRNVLSTYGGGTGVFLDTREL